MQFGETLAIQVLLFIQSNLRLGVLIQSYILLMTKIQAEDTY